MHQANKRHLRQSISFAGTHRQVPFSGLLHLFTLASVHKFSNSWRAPYAGAVFLSKTGDHRSPVLAWWQTMMGDRGGISHKCGRPSVAATGARSVTKILSSGAGDRWSPLRGVESAGGRFRCAGNRWSSLLSFGSCGIPWRYLHFPLDRERGPLYDRCAPCERALFPPPRGSISFLFCKDFQKENDDGKVCLRSLRLGV